LQNPNDTPKCIRLNDWSVSLSVFIIAGFAAGVMIYWMAQQRPKVLQRESEINFQGFTDDSFDQHRWLRLMWWKHPILSGMIGVSPSDCWPSQLLACGAPGNV
jgi:hypothetical protein